MKEEQFIKQIEGVVTCLEGVTKVIEEFKKMLIADIEIKKIQIKKKELDKNNE